MKHLFILILSSFFFTASLHSNVSSGSEELAVIENDGNPYAEKSVGYSIGIDYDAIVTLTGKRTRFGYQWKSSRCVNFVRTCAIASGFAAGVDEIPFIRPYAYCKPIALKLVFPQHYFW